MKNTIFISILGISLLMSCSGAKQAQVNKSEFMKLKGNWELTNVDYNNKSFKIKPFGEGADASCWIGSQWNLVPNNYTGSYSLNGLSGNCPQITQPFKFEVKEGNIFQFKKIAEGTKAKENTQGYTLILTNQTDSEFNLQQTIPFDGESVVVSYQFQKISK